MKGLDIGTPEYDTQGGFWDALGRLALGFAMIVAGAAIAGVGGALIGAAVWFFIHVETSRDSEPSKRGFMAEPGLEEEVGVWY